MSKERPEKQKMATSSEVYNRIIWDARLNSSAFVIGFQERLSDTGVREKPLTQWTTDSDIPWHRIRYIRCGEVIVWDRDRHIDLISSGQLPDAAWKKDSAATLVFDQVPIFNTRSVYQYNQPVEPILESINLDRLTIVTFNVLCDRNEPDKIHTAKRLPAIVEHLRQCNADIIALQEATPSLLDLLRSQDWASSYFISSAPTGETLEPYGNLLLSRLPFTLVEHQFSPQKRVLVGTWEINGEPLHVAVVHLTSNAAQNSVKKRTHQLSTLLAYLQTQPGNSLIVGDFNIKGNEQSDILEASGFVDIWQKLHPYDLGYTFDPQLNPLATIMSRTGEAARFDRILLLSASFYPQSIEFFAREPIPNTLSSLYPSDHFGLRAVLQFSPNNQTDLLCITPVHQTAVIVIPPESVLPAIQKIRRRYDSKFDRWMPHVTLLYGFIPESYFAEAAEAIATVLARLEPFKVTLADFATFSDRKTTTAWLRPVTQPEGALIKLQAALEELFPQCNEQSRKGAAFTPHLTVGQFASEPLAIANLPQWHPISFTVDSIALVSRRDNEPCSVRYTIPLGKISPLLQLVNQLEPQLDVAQQVQRQTVIEVITQACTECLGYQPSLQILGSARLGVQTPQSDLDIVCLIPPYISGDVFLSSTQQRLEGLCDRSQLALDAKVPVLRMQIEGIPVDLLAAQVEGLPTPALEADLIMDVVRSHVPLDAYRWLLRAVRAWAKARKIYGNSWGFLGGFSWALLTAWSCSQLKNSDTNPEALILNLFQALNNHDWRQPVALTEAGKQYKLQSIEKLPVITSIEPCQNSARNITRSTAQILKQEFARAEAIAQEILAGKLDWASLFEPTDLLAQSDIFLALTATSQNPENLEKCCGTLESYAIGLVIQLEKHFNIFVRPWTGIEKKNNTVRIVFGLNLSPDCDVTTVEKLSLDFVSQFNSGVFAAEILHLTKKQL